MDIDIDVPSTFKPENYFNCVRALRVESGNLKPHVCGVYFQNMPTEQLTGLNLATIEYKEAEQLGFTKIDFLHLSLLDNFVNKADIRQLVHIDPNWSLLQRDDVIPNLFHLAKHGDILKEIKPKSIEELADCLAIIRPGKRKLVPYYRERTSWVRSLLYQQNEDQYSFKRSHAIAYAHVVVLQLHLINYGIETQ